jgi:tellurite resistance protein
MTQRSIEAEIGLCLLFSAVDGEISEQELGALSDRVGHLLGDDFDVMRLPGLLEGELGAIAEEGVDAYVARLPSRIRDEHRFEAIRAACAVACADGLAPEEEEVVRQVCGVLEVDPEDVIEAVGARNDTIGAAGAAHDDEPDEKTKLIADRLGPSGFVDPMQSMRDAGISISGFGALALQYQSRNGHLLRVEHHTCDGSIHLHVTDEADTGSDLVLFAEGKEPEVLEVISSMKDVVTLDNLEQWIAKLLTVARVCIFQGESLVEIERPS